MKVLVTGGSGFVGRHVASRLASAGHEVRIVDRRYAPAGRAEIVTGDLKDSRIVARAVAGVDAVCHLAAMVGMGVGFGDVGDYVADNDVGTARLLEALWDTRFGGRLVLASSMVVYGDGLARCERHGNVAPGPRRAEDLAAGRFEAPCPAPGCARPTTWVAVDEDTPLAPRSVYAATKVHQEHLCSVWGRESGATVVALRYHNVYGPGMPVDTPYAGVAAIFASSLARREPPQVFEDGRQARDFVHVSDVAEANLLALTAPGVVPGAYNVASGTSHTVADLARALAEGAGPAAPAPAVTGRWRLGDVRHIVASPARAAEGLGFVARVSFAAGMAELAAANRANRAGGPGGTHG